MQELTPQILINIVLVLISSIVTFFTTKHGIYKHIQKKHDELLTKQENSLLEIERLKNKDELQQQILDQYGKQMDTLLPHLLDAVKKKKDG